MFSTLHRVNKSASVFALCCPTRPGLSAWTLRSWAEAILRTRVSIPISPWGQTHSRGHGLRAYQGGPGTMPFSESCEGFSLQPSLFSSWNFVLLVFLLSSQCFTAHSLISMPQQRLCLMHAQLVLGPCLPSGPGTSFPSILQAILLINGFRFFVLLSFLHCSVYWSMAGNLETSLKLFSSLLPVTCHVLTNRHCSEYPDLWNLCLLGSLLALLITVFQFSAVPSYCL